MRELVSTIDGRGQFAPTHGCATNFRAASTLLAAPQSKDLVSDGIGSRYTFLYSLSSSAVTPT